MPNFVPFDEVNIRATRLVGTVVASRVINIRATRLVGTVEASRVIPKNVMEADISSLMSNKANN